MATHRWLFLSLALLGACDPDSDPVDPLDPHADAAVPPAADAAADAAPAPDGSPDATPLVFTVDVQGAGHVVMDVGGTTSTCRGRCDIDLTGRGHLFRDVRLTAIADGGAVFQGWSDCYGGLDGDDDRCRLIESRAFVRAPFAPLTTHVARTFATPARDTAVHLVAAPDGAVVLGWVDAVPFLEQRYELAKITADGSVAWTRAWRFTDPVYGRYGVAVAADGTVLVTGARHLPPGGDDRFQAVVLVLDGATGEDVREIPVLEAATAIAPTPDGGFFVCGNESFSSVFGHDLARYAADGRERWSRGGLGRCQALVTLPGGDALVESIDSGSTVDMVRRIRYDGERGDVTWQNGHSGFDYTDGFGVTADANRVFATGTNIARYVSGFAADTGAELWTFETGSTGFPVTPVLVGDEVAVAVGGLYGTFGPDEIGYPSSSGLLYLDAPTGAPVRARRLGGAGLSSRMIAAGPDGSLWVAGELAGADPAVPSDVLLRRVTP